MHEWSLYTLRQARKHSRSETVISQAMWYLSTLYCMFMQIATISVWCFEKCSRLQRMCPCCVLPRALTLFDILKSRQPISCSSHHLKGNECHLIEIGSLSPQRSNIISHVLFAATCSFTPVLKMHWTTLAMYYLKVSSCKNAFSVSETVLGTRYICIRVSKFLERQLVCQLTGCYVVTCVRVKMLTVLLTLSSKPLAFLWTPSTLRPLCDHQSLFSPVHSA